MILKLTVMCPSAVQNEVDRRELCFQAGTFESVEDTSGYGPGNTHLRSTSGGCWDIEEGPAEHVAAVIAYVNETALPMGSSKSAITFERVEELMREDREAEAALVGAPKGTTLEEVEEVLTLAWSDATNLEGHSPSKKMVLCDRIKHAVEYLDEEMKEEPE